VRQLSAFSLGVALLDSEICETSLGRPQRIDRTGRDLHAELMADKVLP
jgi:hypothetical protein